MESFTKSVPLFYREVIVFLVPGIIFLIIFYVYQPFFIRNFLINLDVLLSAITKDIVLIVIAYTLGRILYQVGYFLFQIYFILAKKIQLQESLKDSFKKILVYDFNPYSKVDDLAYDMALSLEENTVAKGSLERTRLAIMFFTSLSAISLFFIYFNLFFIFTYILFLFFAIKLAVSTGKMYRELRYGVLNNKRSNVSD